MNAQRVGEAEENAGAGGVKRIVAREHHCDDSDPTAPSAHVLGENADRAERELRAGKSGQRSREDNRDNTVARHVDAQSFGRVRSFADAPQPEACGRLEQDDRDDGGQRPGDPGQGGPKAQPITGTPRIAGIAVRPSPTIPGSLKVPLTPNTTRKR